MAKPVFAIAGCRVAPGQVKDLRLKVSERYTGEDVILPVRVQHAKESGPVVLVTAAVHGDELNGFGIVHQLMYGEPIELLKGTLVLVPVVNIFGFESQVRYMSDRRDLNRCFPGTSRGSLASRVASTVFKKIISKCQIGIDLHAAAAPRMNFPNVRGDQRNATIRKVSRAFGCELILNSPGPEGSLRRAATDAGCATICVEAGEPNKIEPAVLDIGVRGVQNVLRSLGMLSGEVVAPPYQTRVDRAMWVRAESGGILRFHVAPGQVLEEGDAIATNLSVFGDLQNTLYAPADGIVLGMTTLPSVQPGEPVCHLAIPRKSLPAIRRALRLSPKASHAKRVRADMASSVSISEAEPGDPAGVGDTLD
ncbi:MAG: putative deacylase [Rhodothermales bacterium]|jgi:predicted deacylase